MIKLPPNTPPEFVSQLANELSIVLKEKYNKPVGSGKLVNDLSSIFGSKDWNTLNAKLKNNGEKDNSLKFAIISDLLEQLNKPELKSFLENDSKVADAFDDGCNELYDLIYYFYGLEDYVDSYLPSDDFNVCNLSTHYQEYGYQFVQGYKSHFQLVTRTVLQHGSQELMKDILCEACRWLTDTYDGDHPYIPNPHYILTLFNDILTNETFIEQYLTGE